MLFKQCFVRPFKTYARGKFTQKGCFASASAALLIGLTGCTSAPKTFEIRAEADPVINRDTSGNPLSVVVHVYQLRDANEFAKLTFDTLASGRPVNELLGKDLLEKDEVLLVPGATYSNTNKLGEETKYLGIVALFRQPDQHYWRYLVDADSVRKSGLRFKVQDCYLALSSIRPSVIPGQPDGAPPACANSSPQVAGPAASQAGAHSRPNVTPQIRKRVPQPESTGIGRAAPM